MTAQISDDVVYQGRSFNLAGVKGKGLFDPKEHGLSPQAHSSACWRGCQCVYEVVEDELRLKTLNIALSQEDAEAAKQGEGTRLFGKLPGERQEPAGGILDEIVAGRFESMGLGFLYDDLQEMIPFIGGLLLGSGFLPELYVHMGFHPAYKFLEVHELTFEQGALTKASDRSEEMADFRKSLARDSLKPADADDLCEVKRWIERAFSLDYK